MDRYLDAQGNKHHMRDKDSCGSLKKLFSSSSQLKISHYKIKVLTCKTGLDKTQRIAHQC